MTAIKLNEVRKEFKSVNIATIGNVLSVIYALINNYSEKQTENALDNKQVEKLKYLTKILPQSKTQAKKYIADIEKYGNVGSTRTITKKDGATAEYTIRPSIDMVLRYFVAEYNKNIPEAQLEKKVIKHECATHKPAQCRQKVETADTVKALNK